MRNLTGLLLATSGCVQTLGAIAVTTLVCKVKSHEPVGVPDMVICRRCFTTLATATRAPAAQAA